MEYFHYLFNPEILFNESFNDIIYIIYTRNGGGARRDVNAVSYCLALKLGAVFWYVCVGVRRLGACIIVGHIEDDVICCRFQCQHFGVNEFGVMNLISARERFVVEWLYWAESGGTDGILIGRDFGVRL